MGSETRRIILMGIKDKATYGEYYWAMQVEAQKFFGDETEKL
ncbi:unnamed protein product [marine sediment metagenome]|uniref:Uncharacterized protein n=1 Tax=marine sediment metagenome TaxID=412755 RepID=X1HQV1_9ZZZZ